MMMVMMAAMRIRRYHAWIFWLLMLCNNRIIIEAFRSSDSRSSLPLRVAARSQHHCYPHDNQKKSPLLLLSVLPRRNDGGFFDNPSSGKIASRASEDRLLFDSSSAFIPTMLLLLPLLLFPLACLAIDHPVDHPVLGIPKLVPDYRYFVSGGICAAISHGITTPIDVIKTRIQAEPLAFSCLSLSSAATRILQKDGAFVLLDGLAPTVTGYGLEGAAKFGLYESLKPVFAALASTQAAGYLGASVAAGAVASLLLVPLEQARIKVVTDSDYASGLVTALTRMAQEEELGAVLFGGFPAMLSKQVPSTFCKQVSFEVFAAMLYSAAYNASIAPTTIKTEVSIAAAFLASILACIASHPSDVILTDTYKKGAAAEAVGSDDDGVVPQFTNVVSTIYAQEGVSGFFSGINARFLHVGAIIISQLVLYDYIKQLLGLLLHNNRLLYILAQSCVQSTK